MSTTATTMSAMTATVVAAKTILRRVWVLRLRLEEE
jgi:hypothetical protein